MSNMILQDLKTGQITVVDVEREFGFNKEEELAEFIGREIKKELEDLGQ